MVNQLPPSFEFDIEKWKSLFPIARFPLDERIGIVGPGDLARIDQIREKAFQSDDPTIPTDVFVLALGEAPRRDVTKIGGLPYRPSSIAWPTSNDGKPMTFLVQFRFVESKEILPPLPGDVMLVFVKDIDTEPSYYFFEWWPIGIDDLIQKDELPHSDWNFVNCYGIRHRTVDYSFPDLNLAKEKLSSKVSKSPSGWGKSWWPSMICWLHGLKIGGVPSWLDLEDPSIRHYSGKKLLCSLPVIVPAYNRAFPWINHPDPIRSVESCLSPEHSLFLYDGFCIYFFLQSDNGKYKGISAYYQIW